MTQQVSEIEVILMKELFVADNLHTMVQEARRRGFIFTELRIDPVANRTQYISKKESTTPTPIIYLEKEQKPEALILQGPKDDRYRMFEYRWIG